MAKAKQATTIATQRALVALDLAVAMCTRPWIVELSKKIISTSDPILVKHKVLEIVLASPDTTVLKQSTMTRKVLKMHTLAAHKKIVTGDNPLYSAL